MSCWTHHLTSDDASRPAHDHLPPVAAMWLWICFSEHASCDEMASGRSNGKDWDGALAASSNVAMGDLKEPCEGAESTEHVRLGVDSAGCHCSAHVAGCAGGGVSDSVVDEVVSVVGGVGACGGGVGACGSGVGASDGACGCEAIGTAWPGTCAGTRATSADGC